MSGDESSLYSRIIHVHSPDGELRWECPGIIKTMHTGFSKKDVLEGANALGADMEETGRYGWSVERFVWCSECSQ